MFIKNRKQIIKNNKFVLLDIFRLLRVNCYKLILKIEYYYHHYSSIVYGGELSCLKIKKLYWKKHLAGKLID